MKSILSKTLLCTFTLCLSAGLGACRKKESDSLAPPPAEVSDALAIRSILDEKLQGAGTFAERPAKTL